MNILLELSEDNEERNADNITRVLKVLDKFFALSGLFENKGNTKLSVYGKPLYRSNLTNTAELQW